MSSAVVVGATGGIGGALVHALAGRAKHSPIWAFSRSGADPGLPNVLPGQIDILDEPSIAAVAARVAEGPSPRLVIGATGMLHEGDCMPERSWRDLDAERLARAFAVNTIGPALVAKHFLPLLPREGRSVLVMLGARVGSIGDNRLGGWHGYRMSKSALAMLVRTLAIELSRRAPDALCIALHPGTVATNLSAPFQRNLAEGQLTSPDIAAANLLAVLDRLTTEDSGWCFDWKGERVPA